MLLMMRERSSQRARADEPHASAESARRPKSVGESIRVRSRARVRLSEGAGKAENDYAARSRDIDDTAATPPIRSALSASHKATVVHRSRGPRGRLELCKAERVPLRRREQDRAMVDAGSADRGAKANPRKE